MSIGPFGSSVAIPLIKTVMNAEILVPPYPTPQNKTKAIRTSTIDHVK